MILLLGVSDTLKILFNKDFVTDSLHIIKYEIVKNNSFGLEQWYWIAGMILGLLTLIAVVIYAIVTSKTYKQIKEQSKAIRDQSEAMIKQSDLLEVQTKLMTKQMSYLFDAFLDFHFVKSKSYEELELEYNGQKDVMILKKDYLNISDYLRQRVLSTISAYYINTDVFKPGIYSLVIKNYGKCAVNAINFKLSVTYDIPEEIVNKIKASSILDATTQNTDDSSIFSIVELLQPDKTFILPIINIDSFPKYTLEIKGINEIKGSYTDIHNNNYEIPLTTTQKDSNQSLQETCNMKLSITFNNNI